MRRHHPVFIVALALASLFTATAAQADCAEPPGHCMCEGVEGTIFAGNVVGPGNFGSATRVLVDRVEPAPSADASEHAIDIGSEVDVPPLTAPFARIIGFSPDGTIAGATSHIGMNQEVVRVCRQVLFEDDIFAIMTADSCWAAARHESIEPPEHYPCDDNGCTINSARPRGDLVLPFLIVALAAMFRAPRYSSSIGPRVSSA